MSKRSVFIEGSRAEASGVCGAKPSDSDLGTVTLVLRAMDARPRPCR